MPGFQSFFSYLHHFVLAKLASSSIRVKSMLCYNCWLDEEQEAMTEGATCVGVNTFMFNRKEGMGFYVAFNSLGHIAMRWKPGTRKKFLSLHN